KPTHLVALFLTLGIPSCGTLLTGIALANKPLTKMG
ncbi:MAG: hypothetical protein ACI91Z_001698, partial [Yoonia sp.]